MSEPNPQAPARKRPPTPTRRIPPLRGRLLFNDIEWSAVHRALDLSERELDIMKGLFDEKTKPEIADALGLSAHTIHTYLSRLYRKLGVRSRPAAVLRAFEAYLRAFPRKSSDVELLRDLFSGPSARFASPAGSGTVTDSPDDQETRSGMSSQRMR